MSQSERNITSALGKVITASQTILTFFANIIQVSYDILKFSQIQEKLEP